jgi:glycosyltransferase involved in cell wall biosynthesis
MPQMDNKIKRILFIVTQSEFGGAQRFLYNFISNLSKSRYEIRVAVGSREKLNCNHKKLDIDNKEFYHLIKDINVPVTELKFLVRDIDPFKDIAAVFEIIKLVKNFSPDTVFLNSSKAGFVGSLAIALMRNNSPIHPKIIYRIGGWSFNDPQSKWKKKLLIFLEKLSAKWKDIIIVNSQHDFEQAHKFKIKPKEKIVLIHNGIDVYKTEFLSKEEAKKFISKNQHFDISAYQNVIGVIANFYPTKGLKYLIEAAEYFKNRDDIVFVIIGDGLERKELENLIKQKNMENKIFLLGHIPHAHKLLSAFDIFVLPSIKEGFPWVVLEAMAAKLPVIATKVGAVPEIIENGKNGFIIEPARPDKIAENIQILLKNDHLRQELGIQAHQTVLFNFELDKMLEKTEKLL